MVWGGERHSLKLCSGLRPEILSSAAENTPLVITSTSKFNLMVSSSRVILIFLLLLVF